MRLTKLKKLMEDRAIRSSTIARRVGVSGAALHQWREGKARMPAEAALILADIFDVDPREIIGYVEEQSEIMA